MRTAQTRREFLKASGSSVAALYVLGLAGCGGDGGSSSGVVEVFNDKPGAWSKSYAEMGKLSKKQIGIGMKGVPFQDPTAFQQAIQQSLRAGGEDTPDLFTWWSGYRLDDLARAGGLEDISSIWDSQTQKGNLSENLALAFTFDGKQYAVPGHVSYYPVFYNKKVFEEQGLQPPETWDELMSMADALKQAGVTPFYATIDGRWPSLIWFEELMIRSDPDFYDRLMQGEESYTDPFVVNVFEEWRSMIEADYFSTLDIPMDSTAVGKVSKGEIAMMPIGTWFNAQFIAGGMKPVEDYGTFVLPNLNPDLEENVIVVETGALGIPTNAADTEASMQVAEWWVSPKAATAWAEHLGDIPINPTADASNPLLGELVSTVQDGDYRFMQRYWEATPPEIVENAVEELVRFMLHPEELMDVLQTIQTLAENEWNKRG
jgi:multiple sugar transport system substrate-binding protein